MQAMVQYGRVEYPSFREVCLLSRLDRVFPLSLLDWVLLLRSRLDRLRDAAAADGECDSSSLPLSSVDECFGVETPG